MTHWEECLLIFCLNFCDEDGQLLLLRIFIFLVILIMFWPICPLIFFICFMLNLGVQTEYWTEPFIRTTGVDFSYPLNHELAQVFSYNILFCYSYLLLGLNLPPSDDFIWNHFPTKHLRHWTMCTCQMIQSEFLGLINLISLSSLSYQMFSCHNFFLFLLPFFTIRRKTLTSLLRCRWYILQPQLTGLSTDLVLMPGYYKGFKVFSTETNISYMNGPWLIIISIIMSCHQHRSPWPSPTTLLYHPSLPVGLLGYILYRHRAVVCRF